MGPSLLAPFGPGTTSKSKIHPVPALEHQDFARLIRRRDFQSQPLDDLARLGDLRGIRLGELAGADPQRVLKADAYVAAHRGCHRGDLHLVAARAEHGPVIILAAEEPV